MGTKQYSYSYSVIKTPFAHLCYGRDPYGKPDCKKIVISKNVLLLGKTSDLFQQFGRFSESSLFKQIGHYS